MMAIRYLEKSPEAYTYPLLIKHLLHAPLAAAPHQEIVYRDRTRLSYAEFGGRLCRLANALTKLGVRSGSTVAVMDWDSHRYLECYFAIPMLGAVLQTVNVRLSPQEILFTLQSTQAEVVLVNRDFLPLLTQMRSQLPQLEAVVLLDDDGDTSDRPRWVVAEYESLLAGADSHYEFEDFD